MQEIPEVAPEHFITCSKSIVLECRCGEKLILLGREGHTIFTCGGCGTELSLADFSMRMVHKIIKV